MYSDKEDFIYVTMLINGGFNGYDERLASLNAAVETLDIATCAKLNRNGLYLFKGSEAYNKAKPSFAWGLWSDPESSSKGKAKTKRMPLKATQGLSRYMTLMQRLGEAIRLRIIFPAGNLCRQESMPRIESRFLRGSEC